MEPIQDAIYKDVTVFIRVLKSDPLQKPALLSYCCYGWQAMALSRHTSCSHAVKNTLRSKEETDNTPTDKTEKASLGMNVSAFKFCHFSYNKFCFVAL